MTPLLWFPSWHLWFKAEASKPPYFLHQQLSFQLSKDRSHHCRPIFLRVPSDYMVQLPDRQFLSLLWGGTNKAGSQLKGNGEASRHPREIIMSMVRISFILLRTSISYPGDSEQCLSPEKHKNSLPNISVFSNISGQWAKDSETSEYKVF